MRTIEADLPNARVARLAEGVESRPYSKFARVQSSTSDQRAGANFVF